MVYLILLIAGAIYKIVLLAAAYYTCPRRRHFTCTLPGGVATGVSLPFLLATAQGWSRAHFFPCPMRRF